MNGAKQKLKNTKDGLKKRVYGDFFNAWFD